MLTEHRTAEIAHVLFVDIVDYSRESTPNQARLVGELTRVISETKSYTEALNASDLMCLPTGDGMALLFFTDVSAPARCAREISEALRGSALRLRMGIHSGLIQRQPDISGKENVVGEGINMAQRVMSLAGENQILLSAQYGDWLRQFEEWTPFIHAAGEAEVKHGIRLSIFNLYDTTFGNPTRSHSFAPTQDRGRTAGNGRVVLLYKRKCEPDETLLAHLERSLSDHGYSVFIDRHLKVGVEWAKAIEEEIRRADAVVAIVSDNSVGSEMLEYELETAYDEYRQRGRPALLPIRVGSDKPLEGAVGSIINPLNFSVWSGPEDDKRVLAEILSALAEPLRPLVTDRQLEPVGGAVLPDSPFYVERYADAEYLQALRDNESIILIKGPRQIGKTSLLGRGTRLARELGWRHALTDFQKLSTTQLQSEESFYKLLAATLARQMKFQYDFANEWIDVFGPNMNMDNFIRSLLESDDVPLVWFIDEADKLFGAPFASDFFGLVRSWHNSRATEPEGPWQRLTLVIAYATEAHLFIKDLNQSPFNVGRHLELKGFTYEQTAELNQRYGSPITGPGELERLYHLLSGQPFLTRRALDVLARHTLTFPELMEKADRDDGVFGDHLKRILVSVSQMPQVMEAIRNSLSEPEIPDSETLYRLTAAGVVSVREDGTVTLACELYKRYLTRHMTRT